MKLPSLEEAFNIAIKAIQAFEKEVEEIVEELIKKVKEMFGYS